MFNKELFKLLMLLIFYTSILFHFISVGVLLLNRHINTPIFLPIFCLSFFSLLADGLTALLYGTGVNTIGIINLYSAAEVLAVTWIALKMHSFSRVLKLFVAFVSIFLAFSILISSVVFGVNVELDFLWTTSIVFEAILSIVTSVLIVLSLNRNEARLPIEVIVLVGVLIYTTCSIIPIASFNFRKEYIDPIISSTVYSLFVCSGNIIRDLTITIFGLRAEKK